MNKIIKREDGKVEVIDSFGCSVVYQNLETFEAVQKCMDISMREYRNSGLFEDQNKLLKQMFEKDEQLSKRGW